MNISSAFVLTGCDSNFKSC